MLSASPSEKEVESLLALPIGLVVSLEWSQKNGGYTPPQYVHYSAVDLETGAIIEGVSVKAWWRELPISGVTPKYNFAIFIAKHRVYAFDYDLNCDHMNKVGRGRPYYGQRLRGSHVHFWAENTYGYAEPVSDELASGDMEQHWRYFCEQANLVRNIEFKSPIFERDSGQGRLPV